MNVILQNIKNRRSIRSFENKQITDEELNLLLEAAVYAPSGMNRQCWKFTALQNNEMLKNLSTNIKISLGMPQDRLYNFYGAPTLIIVSNDRSCKTGALDCAAALENIFLAATSLGLGSCWINQLNDCCDQAEIRTLLTSFDIPENHIVWGCAAIGYPLESPTAKPRNNNITTVIK